MYQATFSRTTRNDEIDAFPMASLYDKYISKYNNNLSIYDYHAQLRMYNGFMKRRPSLKGRTRLSDAADAGDQYQVGGD